MAALTETQETLIAAQEALREGRHLLKTVSTQLLSTTEPPKHSPLAQALKMMEEAEAAIRKELIKSVR